MPMLTAERMDVIEDVVDRRPGQISQRRSEGGLEVQHLDQQAEDGVLGAERGKRDQHVSDELGSCFGRQN